MTSFMFSDQTKAQSDNWVKFTVGYLLWQFAKIFRKMIKILAANS